MDTFYTEASDNVAKSDGEDSTDKEPIAKVRRKFRNRGESVRAGARLLKTEPQGKEGKTYQWTPAGHSSKWSEWEEVPEGDEYSLKYFKRNLQLYEIEEIE